MSDVTKTDNEMTPTQTGGENPKVNEQDLINKGVDIGFAKGAEKAKAELLSSLGVDNIDSLKSIIEERKAAEEASKTELDRLQEQLQALQAEKEALALEANKAKTKAEVASLSAANGIQDAEVFEMIYNSASTAEDFSPEKLINDLRESKPYLFGQASKPKVDSSPNKGESLDRNELAKKAKELASQGKTSEARKLLDQLYK
jgi:hypothetical protein